MKNIIKHTALAYLNIMIIAHKDMIFRILTSVSVALPTHPCGILGNAAIDRAGQET